MRILFLGQSLDEHAGWGRYAWEVVRRVQGQHEVQVLVEEGSNKAIERAVLKKATSLAAIWRNVQTVRKAAKDFDVIHALDGYPYALYGAWARGTRQKFFINGIGSYSVAPLTQGLKGFFLKRAYAKAQRIFCISRFTLQEMEKRTGLKNLQAVHLGVDLEKFKNFVSDRQDFLIVSVGALKFRKGYHIALQAVAEIRKTFPQVQYKIVGRVDQSGYTRQLQEYVAKNGLSGAVEFMGDLSDEELVKLYNQARVFMLLPVNQGSHFEGFGLVFLEAAACGVPVVGTLGNGDEDAVKRDQNGFLVAQNDPQGAARAVGKLFGDRQLWGKFSAAGLDFAKDFTWEATVASYLKTYESVQF